MIILNILFAMITSSELHAMWLAINTLCLIIHLPLNGVTIPANSTILFKALISLVTFDVVDLPSYVGLTIDEGFTPTAPYNANFE